MSELTDHIQSERINSYINQYENEFEDWLAGIAACYTSNEPDTIAARHIVQNIVNCYYEEKGKFSPDVVPRFTILHMLIKLTGASTTHSANDEMNDLLQATIEKIRQ
jgi:hypothetical protein